MSDLTENRRYGKLLEIEAAYNSVLVVLKGIIEQHSELIFDKGNSILILDLGLSMRAINVINILGMRRSMNIKTVGMLKHFSQMDLLRTKNCGRMTLNEIINALKNIGVSLDIE